MSPPTETSVHSILDKENFTLTEILDQDDLYLELFRRNERLIIFLSQTEQIQQLIEYALDDSNLDRSWRACSVLGGENEVAGKALVENDEMLDRIFSFISVPEQLDKLPSHFFGEVVFPLLMFKKVPLVTYFQDRREDILPKLVEQIENDTANDVLFQLFSTDDSIYSGSMELVVELIVTRHSSSDCSSVHRGCVQFLSSITRCCSPSVAFELIGALVHQLNDLPNNNALYTPCSKFAVVEYISDWINKYEHFRPTNEALITYGLELIRCITGLLFDYPDNISLHGHVDLIIERCLGSKELFDHLFKVCDLPGLVEHGVNHISKTVISDIGKFSTEN